MDNAELRDWTSTIRVHSLASKVLVVAETRIEGTWAAYCDAVPGMFHDKEYDAVLRRGDKLMEEIARIIFPVFADLPYAH